MQIQKILSKSLLLSFLLASFAQGDSFDSYRNAQQDAFDEKTNSFIEYRTNLLSEFSRYQKAEQKAYSSYKKSLQKYWGKVELTTQKKLVHYSKDKKTKTAIDFEHEVLRIATIANNKKEAKKRLQAAFLYAITTDTKKLYTTDALFQKLAKIKKPKNIQTAPIDAKPILSNIIFKQAPTAKELINFTHKEFRKNSIEQKTNKQHNKMYTIQIQLPKNTNYKRSITYKKEVQRADIKEQIAPALIFAVIHTESCFNPYARSHIPAYGLMQIVPRTAGIDSFYYLYREKKLLGSSYLYNSRNNITLGSAYLHILYYNYLKAIKNPQSRLYCTIAAYNTGAGNVARAFVHNNSVAMAAKKINAMQPQEVYNHLRVSLKYAEARAYLKKVEERRKVYEKLYGS